MRLILCRHGNTFGPGDAVVWTGSSNDLPLVEKGFEQAEAVANWLADNHYTPDKIYAGHLKRVHDFASHIKDKNNLATSLQSDARLNEIDYGAWTGKSDENVIAHYGASDIQNWREKSQFPSAGIWGESEVEVLARTKNFMTDLMAKAKQDETIFIVSSNGILRYLLKGFDEALFQSQLEKGEFQVKTGRLCMLSLENGVKTLNFWNKDPSA